MIDLFIIYSPKLNQYLRAGEKGLEWVSSKCDATRFKEHMAAEIVGARLKAPTLLEYAGTVTEVHR